MASHVSSLPAKGLRTVAAGRSQRTLGAVARCTGIGLHTGVEVTMSIHPAPPGTGVVFVRKDLPGSPRIPAQVKNVVATPRSTVIGLGEARVHTVEHVLAALFALQVDNAIVELSNEEPPVMDGSSIDYLRCLKQAGFCDQEEEAEAYVLEAPVHFSDAGAELIALPSDDFRISYTLDHPERPAVGCQFYSLQVTSESFEQQIAPARTFCFYEWVEALQKQGLIKGGNLANALVFKGEEVISEEGPRYPNEPVRHKILDVIGDLSLLGKPLFAHIISIRSGHTSNVGLARTILGGQ